MRVCKKSKSFQIAGLDYESEGRTFESFRARQRAHCWHKCFVQCIGELLPRPARRGSMVEAALLLPPIRIERLIAGGGWLAAASELHASASLDLRQARGPTRAGRDERAGAILRPIVQSHELVARFGLWPDQGFSTPALHQRLPDIGLRNSKLPCDRGRLDACFEGGAHCIQLASGQ